MPANFVSPAWAPHETDILLKHATTHTSRQIAAMLPGRTIKGVESRLRHLNVKDRKPARSWSAEEDAVLREHHATKSPAHIAVLLDKRNAKNVRDRLDKLGLPRLARAVSPAWTKEDDEILLAHKSMKRAARILGRSHRACESRKGRLCKPWTEDDDEPTVEFTPADELALLQAEYPGQSYRNYRIPSEGFGVRRFAAPLTYSPTGSSMAMCAGAK